MNEDCSKQSCDVPKNAVQVYLNQYSLNQVVVKNTEFVAVINGVTITIPAGKFSYPVSNSTTEFQNITFQGCQSLISIPVPAGSSMAQIQALVQGMLNQAAQQQAECDAAASGSGRTTVFVNQQISLNAGCAPGSPLSLSASIPPYVSTTSSAFIISGGIFSSAVSQDDANSKASAYLLGLISELFTSGDAVCGCNAGCSIAPFYSSDVFTPSISSVLCYQTNGGSNSFYVLNPTYPKHIAMTGFFLTGGKNAATYDSDTGFSAITTSNIASKNFQGVFYCPNTDEFVAVASDGTIYMLNPDLSVAHSDTLPALNFRGSGQIDSNGVLYIGYGSGVLSYDIVNRVNLNSTTLANASFGYLVSVKSGSNVYACRWADTTHNTPDLYVLDASLTLLNTYAINVPDTHWAYTGIAYCPINDSLYISSFNYLSASTPVIHVINQNTGVEILQLSVSGFTASTGNNVKNATYNPENNQIYFPYQQNGGLTDGAIATVCPCTNSLLTLITGVIKPFNEAGFVLMPDKNKFLISNPSNPAVATQAFTYQA